MRGIAGNSRTAGAATALALAAATFVIPLAAAQPAAAASECKGRIDFAKSRNYYAIMSSDDGDTREAARYNDATVKEIGHALPACRNAHHRERVRDLLKKSEDYAERALDANRRKDRRQGREYEEVVKARLEEALYRA
ncbi:hypothetical protein FCH28_08220 [Streptomyces piniterrae]|uniref:Uncharacterized protein n=1 Tax=Streptomyces piniterrae TaxID=2571125 RepID=A0A4U0NS34_9ACTN|nr:hypothetical protein [Streptomyces piniterrae]TJZ57396.1 hypothetical protein FCH28_08220 [Streptomyces piniterrae]